MKTIMIARQGYPHQSWDEARKGDVWHVFLHGLKYSPELRQNPPRVRLLEDVGGGLHTKCELIDEWPDAPEYWPPESAPEAADQGRNA